MKHVLLILSIVVFLPLWAFAQFEGTIKMTTENPAVKENAQVEWQLKDGKHLMAFQSQSEDNNMNYSLLIEDGQEKFWFISKEPTKAAYAIPMSELEGRDLGLPINSIVKKGDKTQKIAGYECQHYRILSNKVTVDMWLAENTGLTFSDFPPFMRNGSLMGLLRINGMKGIPLKSEARNLAGELVNSQAIEAIEPGKLSDSTFEISDDYVKNPGRN